MATKVTTGLLSDNAVTDAKLSATITATTQSASDNTTKVATTAYVSTAIANLADSAPSTLDTLNELAAALGDDANYATTTTNAIAAKLPLAGGTMTGNLTVNAIVDADNYTINGGQGSDGQVLTSTGSGVAWEAIPAGGVAGIVTSADATAITIDSLENVGIGVVPEAWYSYYDVLQIGSGASLAGSTTNKSRAFLNANVYINSSNAQSYIATDEASQYWQNGGTHIFNVAASGTADSTISWTTAMTIDSSGKVGIGTTSPTALLDVAYGDYQNSGALRIGADIGTNTSRTNSTRKIGIISAPHYTNAEDDISLLMIDSEDNACLLSIGGTASAMNSPSSIAFVTSSDAAGTSTGTERMRISNVGETTIKRAGSGGSGVLKALNLNHAGTSVNDGAKISFTAGSSTEGAGIASTGQALHSADLRFYAGGNTERMRILTDGEIVQGSSIADTYNPLVNGITADAFVCNRHSTAGSLGLWRTNTMEWKYYHNGQGYIMTFGSNGVLSGDFNDTSDLNLKENVSTIEDGTTVIKALRPVKFDWKASGKGNNQHGFIAQEVETVLPDAVEGNDYVENETGHPDHEPAQNGKNMNSNAVLAHAVKAIQEQQALIEAQATTIADLTTRIATLEG